MVDTLSGCPESWREQVRWIDLVPDGVLIVNQSGDIVAANAAIQAMSGKGWSELAGQPLSVLLPPEVRGRHGGHLRSFFARPVLRPMGEVSDMALRHQDGHDVSVDISLGVFDIGAHSVALAVVRDITQMKALHARNEYLAMHDALTGLYSCSMLNDLLTRAVMQSLRGGKPLALLLVDLDDFKAVNDGHGHHVGDALLRELANRMTSVLRGSDVVARLGGDEFAVLLHDQADTQATLAVVEKILGVIREPWTSGHHEVFPSASIGVVFAPADGSSGDLLLRHADIAMYRAKAAGRGSYLMYDSQMARDVEERVRIQGRLMRALQEDTLQLHYQPQIEATTGTVAGVEALLRWTDPELGTVSPSVFVNVAEQCGLILPLGDWVLDRACRQFAQWRDEGLVLRVSINVSAHQLKQLSFGEKLSQCLERWQVPAHMFELEITESSAMSSGEHTCRLLSDAVARGVSLALDDFGVGHSSLGQLRALPITRLKLDRSLVNGVVEDERDAQMARAVVALAKGLGMMVVAEGVETEAQCSFLRQEGCHELQGWHFAPAVPPVEIPSLVKRLDQQHSQRCLCLKE